MSTYDEDVSSFILKEQHIYGSSRHGMFKPNKEMIGADTTNEFAFDTLNKRVYEMGNHLNNILLVTYDRKIALDTNSDGLTDFRQVDIASTQDFSSYGVPLYNRGFQDISHNYGFNSGSEKDDEIYGVSGSVYTTEFRELDTRLGGRWWSLDPVVKPWESRYAGFANCPISFSDPSGLDAKDRAERYQRKHGGVLVEGTKGKNQSWSVDEAYIYDDAKSSTGKGVDIKSKVFYNNIFDKIGNALERASNAIKDAYNDIAAKMTPDSKEYLSYLYTLSNMPKTPTTTRGKDMIWFGPDISAGAKLIKEDALDIASINPVVVLHSEKGLGMRVSSTLGDKHLAAVTSEISYWGESGNFEGNYETYVADLNRKYSPVLGNGTSNELLSSVPDITTQDITLILPFGGLNFTEIKLVFDDAVNSMQNYIKTKANEAMHPNKR